MQTLPAVVAVIKKQLVEWVENNLLLYLLLQRVLKWEFYPVRAYILYGNHVATTLR